MLVKLREPFLGDNPQGMSPMGEGCIELYDFADVADRLREMQTSRREYKIPKILRTFLMDNPT